MGHYEVLTITKDSVNYHYKNIRYPKSVVVKISVPEGLWNRLVTNFNEEKFSALKDGKSNMTDDGMNDIYSVVMASGNLKVTNPMDNN